MKNKIYLTTPLYYVNDVPHIGHAYTTIATDVLARWRRLSGHAVFFLTGTDEHGAKIYESAKKTNQETQDYIDHISGEFKRLWTALNISNDDFIQTTQDRHKKVVQAVFEKLKASGDIYKGVYEDWYCMHDESYFSESELIEKKCPLCHREVQKLKEESYFFKLSKYEGKLLDHFSSHPDFLSPKHRAPEIINFVKSGLRDLSVSRSRVKWGITIPSDPEHVVYVWFDALLNYISAIQFETEKPFTSETFDAIWPADVHLVGKEIYRFHTVIWPAMLMALGIPLPKKVFAHGWWTVEGTKMSKSLGNVVDPHKMAADYGVDAFRYFLLREVPFGSDGDFSEKSLLGRYNTELANNLGNLLQRTSTLLVKNFDGVVPTAPEKTLLLESISDIFKKIDTHYDQLEFGGVLETLYAMMVKTNKYIDDNAPWKLGPDQKDKLAAILFECIRVLKALSVLFYPFMPLKSQELWERLGEEGKIEEGGKTILNQMQKNIPPSFKPGQTVSKGSPLFMRKANK